MKRLRIWGFVLAGAAVVLPGYRVMRAQDRQPGDLTVEHADCSWFGSLREQAAQVARERFALSSLTDQVTRLRTQSAGLGTHRADAVPGTPAADPSSMPNLIDRDVFGALKDAGVTPAPKTTDFEFIRRVTLDLTGRLPKPDRVLAFVYDLSPDKRSKLIEELLASPEYVDKWTMYYGDRLKNSARKTQVTLFADGRNAFYAWIKDAVANNRPWDQVVRDVIAAKGTNSFDAKEAQVNWLVGGRVTGGPVQDIWDQQTANIAETFLGISHLNCLLCHNGRGHLDQLSLWGKSMTRYQAWQLSSFLSHTDETITRVDPAKTQPYYWSIQDNVRYKSDYALNTTTGNRPARQPVGSVKVISPVYIFNGDSPAKGENYRDALAREVTSDFQFARASVNYVWAAMFGRGIVDPPNQFDLARLDPDNPPPDPWTLQPSNPKLLKDLAQAFIDSGYDFKALVRLIANSETYQLSSRYDGQWNPQWEPLFARKMVRRLWGEEVMDAVAQTSRMIPTYNTDIGKLNWAMQAPEPLAIGGNFLTSFLPGNRDDAPRKGDGAVQQAMNLMNDTFVMSRTRIVSNATVTSLAASAAAAGSKEQTVNLLYLTVLSRYPSDAEKTAAIAYLSGGNAGATVEDLLWSLYNKVDFIFNY